MAALDYSYIARLVARARSGDSDAYAELFASTYQKQYLFAYTFLENEKLALEVLEETYTSAMKSLFTLDEPRLFVSWLNQINFRICYRLVNKLGGSRSVERQTGKVGSKLYTLPQVMALPFSESQAIFLRFFRGMKIKQIADLMELRKGAVRQYLSSGKKHLALSPAVHTGSGIAAKRRDFFLPPLSEKNADQILANVLAICDLPPCSVTLDVLSSYTEYRRDRFAMQKAILAVILAVFMLLPICFAAPDFDVKEVSRTHTGIPTYEITVHNRLPVSQVTAQLNDRTSVVYESDKNVYTVEPVTNGKLTLTVTLFNRQYRSWSVGISGIDSDPPVVVSSQIIDDSVRIYVTDAGVGVAYGKAYATGQDGEKILPTDHNEEEGYLDFPFGGAMDIFIPDRNGNILQVMIGSGEQTE